MIILTSTGYLVYLLLLRERYTTCQNFIRLFAGFFSNALFARCHRFQIST